MLWHSFLSREISRSVWSISVLIFVTSRRTDISLSLSSACNFLFSSETDLDCAFSASAFSRWALMSLSILSASFNFSSVSRTMSERLWISSACALISLSDAWMISLDLLNFSSVTESWILSAEISASVSFIVFSARTFSRSASLHIWTILSKSRRALSKFALISAISRSFAKIFATSGFLLPPVIAPCAAIKSPSSVTILKV